ncbi:hypothetical protein TNCV_4953151 [Trichonephila clavipes]|nr:hypothetical protein TNCV_4953151 [Trichonephila clavipes]
MRPCPYYLRSRVRQPEGFPEERMNSGIASTPQNNIRRRGLSMEALDGDPGGCINTTKHINILHSTHSVYLLPYIFDFLILTGSNHLWRLVISYRITFTPMLNS